MKKIYYFLLCSMIAFLTGCSNNSDFVTTYKCDMEGKGDWINCKTIGKFGGATGDYSSKVDSVNQFSLGLNKLITEISPNPITMIKVSASIKLEDLDKKCFLVVSVIGPKDEKIYWNGYELNPLAKESNKWYKLDVGDMLPEGYKTEDARVGIYVWNPNKNVAYIDDYTIQFLPE